MEPRRARRNAGGMSWLDRWRGLRSGCLALVAQGGKSWRIRNEYWTFNSRRFLILASGDGLEPKPKCRNAALRKATSGLA